jgi:hypothetical protein
VIPKSNRTYIDGFVGLTFRLKSAAWGTYMSAPIDVTGTSPLTTNDRPDAWSIFKLRKTSDYMKY